MGKETQFSGVKLAPLVEQKSPPWTSAISNKISVGTIRLLQLGLTY